jgi:hypothetical protein
MEVGRKLDPAFRSGLRHRLRAPAPRVPTSLLQVSLATSTRSLSWIPKAAKEASTVRPETCHAVKQDPRREPPKAPPP